MITNTLSIRSRRSVRAWSMVLALCAACGSPAVVAEQVVDLVLVVDGSAATQALDPERTLAVHLRETVSRLGQDDRVSLIAFDDLASPLVPLTALDAGGAEQVAGELETLRFSAQHSNSAAGLERAIYELTQAARPGARQVILLQQSAPIDSGDSDRDREFRRWATDVLAIKAAEAGIELFVLSFGPHADQALGSTLADRTSGRAVETATAGALPLAMASLNESLGASVVQPAAAEPESKPELQMAATPPAAAPPPVSETSTEPLATMTPLGAPQPATIDELEKLPAPAAGPAITLAAATEPIASRDWQAPVLSTDHPVWRALPVAALALFLGAVVFWYARHNRRQESLSAAGPAAQDSEARLIDVGKISGKNSYVITGKMARISRSAGADTENVVTVEIPQDVISRSHAFIELRQGSYWVTDPGSNNGTFVNGARVSGSRRLKHGDRIRFATFEFVFEHLIGQGMAGGPAGASEDAGDATIVAARVDGGENRPGAAATKINPGGSHDDATEIAPSRKATAEPEASAGTPAPDATIVRPAN